MTSNGMSTIYQKLLAIDCYQLGSTRITRSSKEHGDFNTICAGVTMWIGILLDHNDWIGDNLQVQKSTLGRIMKCPLPCDHKGTVLLDSLLAYLDACSDALFVQLSNPDGFKGHLLYKEIGILTVIPAMTPFKGIITGLVKRTLRRTSNGEGVDVNSVKWLRQTLGFLKKLDVSREDIVQSTNDEFFSFEEELTHIVQDQSESPEYKVLVKEMNSLLKLHVSEFSTDTIHPQHGPGAVANAKVKSWFDKNRTMSTDARVAYLLRKSGLGTESEYNPAMGTSLSTRTSRYVCVPKTWKKLRGISAEPTELQFWQQGVLGALDSMFLHDEWWKQRVNLHDQQRSRDGAFYSSITGSYATIDLSAASDSVSLQLVKDVFKGTPLLRWLLGTRSVFSTCEGRTIRLNKFAPMGSACCFPVECIVFALAAEVASTRSRIASLDFRGQVCVFGDDIITPWYSVPSLFTILSQLGFSVNSEKSYWTGKFREACGMEAWAGSEISPCRYKKCKVGLGPGLVTHDNIEALTELANNMLDRGLHTSREFLLVNLLRKQVKLKGHAIAVQSSMFATFSGECSSLASPCPTNFSIVKKFDRGLQLITLKLLVWSERLIRPITDSGMLELHSHMEYVEWLLGHQPGDRDWDLAWISGWLISEKASKPFSRLPVGTVMVPTLRWVIPVSHDCVTLGISPS